MVRQHLYRIRKDGGHTVAVSEGLKDSAWLPLLEQQLVLRGASDLAAPAYEQYPLGFGLVLSCRTPDPFGWEGGCLCHQLVIDDPSDVDELMKIRPIHSSVFSSRYREKGLEVEILPDLPLSALTHDGEPARCFHALDLLFGREETLLARFISALMLCARDRRHGMRVVIGESEAKVSESARQLMELLISRLPASDAMRLSFCTLTPADAPVFSGVVSFTPDDGRISHLSSPDILFNLTARQVLLPAGVVLPDPNQYIVLARALLSHDQNPTGNKPLEPGNIAPSLRMEMPPFEASMSLKQYFAHWRSELETRRSMLTEEAFAVFAADEWPKMLNNMVAASELMENVAFLDDLSDILSTIRRDKLDHALALDDETLSDIITLLLDGVRWRQINLADGRIARLMRTVTAYAQVLTEAHCGEDCLLACLIVYRLLSSPVSIHDSLRDMARLEEISPYRFESLQDCLRQYVQHRLTVEPGLADETLAAASMLAFARFADGVPDLRLADRLVERIEAQSGAKAARRFQNMMDRLRRHLRSSHSGIMHKRDVKLILLVCGALLALIAGISAWFFLLN